MAIVINFRDRTLADRARELTNIALILSEHTDRAFQALELVQTSLMEHMRSLGIISSEDYERQMSEYDVHLLLKHKIKGLPHVDAIAMIDAQGKLINFSRYWPIPVINVADRDYFKALKSNRLLTSFVSEPVRNRNNGVWTIYIARKISDPNDEFLGLVLGAMELVYFEKVFERITLKGNTAINLFRRDGVLLARHPRIESVIGRNFSQHVIFKEILSRADRGAIRAEIAIDGQDRLIATSGAPHFPIAIAVAATISDVLADWKIEAAILISAGATTGLVIALVIIFIARQLLREQKRSSQQLAEEQLRLDAALNNMSQGLFMFDAAARLVLCSRRYLEMYGLSADVVKPGIHFRELLEHCRDTGSFADDPEQYCSQLLTAIAERKTVNHTASTNDGRTIRIITKPMASGGWVATHDDITERRQIQQQLQQAQKMEAVGNLTGGIAHDFNNLLVVIIGNLDLLKTDIAGNRSAEQRLETILQASLRGAQLIRQLLAFSRRQPLKSEYVDINELASNATRLLAQILGESITIDLRLEADLKPVFADAAQLETSLINLAINARDAMPTGGRLTIETGQMHFDPAFTDLPRDLAAGDYAVVKVSDTGIGMSPEVLAHIFDPFFTTKEPGSGTGLGLSMVYGVATQSGGHVTVESTVAKGTTFRLYLPQAADPNIKPNVSEAATQAEAPMVSGEVILVVDDNPEVRLTTITQLRELGYQVCEAHNAQAAMDVLDRNERVDLLFTDIIMPGAANGKELAKKARAKRPDLKILFTSGFQRLSSGSDGEIDDCHPLLSKPYRRHELARVVGAILAAAQ